MSRLRSEKYGLGPTVAQYRKEKGWTQVRLAQESEVPVTAIRRLEQSDQIQLSQLLKIISVLGARLEIIPQGASVGSVEISPPQRTALSTHRKHEIRSLVMHQIIDGLFKRSPQKVIEHGLNNIVRWREGGVDCKDLRTWERVLRRSPQKLSSILVGTDETSIRLRQSSPFPGLVSQKQRQKIFEMHQ